MKLLGKSRPRPASEACRAHPCERRDGERSSVTSVSSVVQPRQIPPIPQSFLLLVLVLVLVLKHQRPLGVSGPNRPRSIARRSICSDTGSGADSGAPGT